MYIEPNTNIRILKSVPLDNTYKHTLYFSENDVAEQTKCFLNYTKHKLDANTYQRVQSGIARVGIKAESLYDCNYMMFQNTNFGNKWFYAFITSVEYINQAVSEIRFEIDVMQTWYFDYELKECFVEREHSTTDVAGDNIVAENIDIGDIVCSDTVGTNNFNSYSAVIATAYDSEGTAGGYIGGLFSGVKYIAGKIDTSAEVDKLLEFIQSATDANKVDSIVSIFIMPTDFYTDGSMPTTKTASVKKPSTIDGYTPKNKKLLTYPYSYLSVDSGDNCAIYRYEYFSNSDNKCNFTMNGCVAPNPEIQLVPMNYNGGDFNYSEKLVMRGFPQVAFSIDAYRAYLAQEASGDVLSMFASGMAVGASGVGITGALGVMGMAQSINSAVLATNRPSQARGNNGGNISVATRTKNFWFRKMHITRQYAELIDKYFDMYGYAINKVKKPYRHSRMYWTYLKTKGCNAFGSVPADDMKKICSIYDNGVTFWSLDTVVGDYWRENTIVSGDNNNWY